MRIGYFIGAAEADSDTLLRQVAERLTQGGQRVCGVVQSNERRPGARRCDMAVRVLPDSPEIGISQSLGPMARGCQLDPDALERAVALTSQRLTADTAVLILNKFGKHEAEGRGFRTVIATALSLDVPVLLKVSPLNLQAFHRFSGCYADLLNPSPGRLIEWTMSNSRRQAKKAVLVTPKR